MQEKNENNNNNNVNGNANDTNLNNEDHDDIQLPQYDKKMFENFMLAYQQQVQSQSVMQEELMLAQALLKCQTSGDSFGNGGTGIGEGSAVDREKNTLYKRFNVFRPKDFKPSNYPWDATEWMGHMEGIFEVIDCVDR